MESGIKYLGSVHGVLKCSVVAFSCTTFALAAASSSFSFSMNFGPSASQLKWVLAAYIIAFSISFLFLVFRLVGLSERMGCRGPCSFDGFDFLWSWFSTSWCFAAAITFAANFPSPGDAEVIVSIVFAYVTFLLYAAEAFFSREFAPANFGFVATKHGWIKTLIVSFGAATFSLLLVSGYPDICISDSCVAGMTYSLVAFTVAWSVSTLLWIAHLVAPRDRIEGSGNLKKVEIIWAVVGVLLFWTGASVFAGYMSQDCNNESNYWPMHCQKSVSGVVAGFITGMLYVAEIFVLK